MGIIYAAFSLFLFIWFGVRFQALAEGRLFLQTISWIPELKINFTFLLDPLSYLFILIITGMGFFIFPYAQEYLKKDPRAGRLLSIMLAFMASMLGLVLSENLVVMFAFWELTSLFSYLLIGHKLESESARSAALQSFLVTSFGGLCLLVGIIFMGQTIDSFSIQELISKRESILTSSQFPIILGFILVGCMTKSAQFPFHFWLPKAMEAPTPVSAYLHSATMVKAGIYLLLRFLPIFGETKAWIWSLSLIGSITALIACLILLTQTDLKLIFAYSTIAALGIMVMLIGLGTPLAVTACLVFIVAHALYKGGWFLIVGAIDHQAGTRDLKLLKGLYPSMQPLFFAAILALGSMAGIVPFLGYVFKERLFGAVAQAPIMTSIFSSISLFVASVFVLAACLGTFRPFLGKTPIAFQHLKAKKLSFFLYASPLALGLIGLVAGFYIEDYGWELFAPIIKVLFIKDHLIEKEIWHQFANVFWTEVIAIGLGVFLYLIWRKMRVFLEKIYAHFTFGPEKIYQLKMNGLMKLTVFSTRNLQSGYLRHYLRTFVGFTVILIVIAFWRSGTEIFRFTPSPFTVFEIILSLIAIIAALFSVISMSRFGIIAALGVVGYCMSLFYLFYGAPDLAMTQFLVDTLGVIVFVLAFYHLPGFSKLSSKNVKLRDALLATSFGAVICLLVLSNGGDPVFPLVSRYYAETSVEKAHSYNIVNAILVDYRALDTLGEITVLALAALGVYGLLKLRIPLKKEES